MEKRVVTAMLLSVALLLGWTWLANLYAPPPAPAPVGGTPTAVTGTIGGATGLPDGSGGVDPVPPGPVAPIPPEAVPNEAVPDELRDVPDVQEQIRTDVFDLIVDSHGGVLAQANVWACEYHLRADGEVRGDPGRATITLPGRPGLLAIGLRGSGVDLMDRPWRVERNGKVVTATTTATLEGGARVEIVKTFRVSTDPAAKFHIDVDVELRGLGQGGKRATLEVVGPWLVRPITPNAAEDGILVALADEDDETEVEKLTAADIKESLAEDPEYEMQAPQGIRWIGSLGDFYLSALESLEPLPSGAYVGFVQGVDKSPNRGAEPGVKSEPWSTAAATLRIPLQVPANGTTETFHFRVYAGPASRPLLTADDAPYHEFAHAVPSRMLSVPAITDLLGWLLSKFAATGMGYGLAVVALTILVRGALFPLSRKSQISMRVHSKRMASIKPKMDAIKKRYKDPKKQQEETMKLMRKEKISPVPGGCLLAFVQMPVWISLYAILQTTYEMRHAKFLWASDLTAPDHLLHLPFAEGWIVLDGWLNLFPILMMITWGISAHMQPLPDDPQQRQTAKMMRWMPMMFGLILYNYPSGLTIYMTCSALWSIGEVQLIRRVWLNKLGV